MDFVFDIDGTLSFNGTLIDGAITRAIQRLQTAGHRVTFASARPVRDLLPIIPAFTTAPLIGGNGVMTRIGGRIRVLAPLPATVMVRIIAIINRYDLDYVVDGDWDYASRVRTDAPILKQLDPQGLAKHVPLGLLERPIKVILLGVPASLQPVISQALRETGVTVIEHSGEGNLDITAHGINKANALAAIGVTDYVAFGNDQNDLEMLKRARYGIWVTSKPELAVPADTQTCSANPAALAKCLVTWA